MARSRNPNASAAPTAPPAPLTVVSTSPTGSGVAGGSTISVKFSTDLAPGSPMPTLTPAVAGTWSVLSPSLLQYQATGPLVPGVTETITVPGGSAGVVGARGQHLAASVSSAFTVAPGSTLRLQQLLAELGYLPLNFTPAAPVTSPAQEGNDQVGSFTWRWAGQPASLTSLWTPGTDNVITQGAVMNFEAQHNLTTDGVAGPAGVGRSADRGAGRAGQRPPLRLRLGERDPARDRHRLPERRRDLPDRWPTPGSPRRRRQQGTWPVFEHLTVTTMSGTNPDGSKYVDPGIPWVSYFHGGDALHGFVRASYGFPQSDGCVEMPIANAAVVFPQTPLGTLVTVA